MKHLSRNIIIATMSLVMFLTGMGANIANFCCESCINDFFAEQKIGFEMKHADMNHDMQHDCCANKHDSQMQNHSDEMSSCDQISTSIDKCCKIERHSILLDSFQSRLDVSIPFVWVADNLPSVFSILESQNIALHSIEKTIEDPPKILSGRSYLSIIRILII